MKRLRRKINLTVLKNNDTISFVYQYSLIALLNSNQKIVFLYYNKIYTLNQRIVATKRVVDIKLHLIIVRL